MQNSLQDLVTNNCGINYTGIMFASAIYNESIQ